MLRGVSSNGTANGPIIDSQGFGGGFLLESAQQVVIDGFHFQNTFGAAAIEAKNTLNLTILSSTFVNCHGQNAGAIAVTESN